MAFFPALVYLGTGFVFGVFFTTWWNAPSEVDRGP